MNYTQKSDDKESASRLDTQYNDEFARPHKQSYQSVCFFIIVDFHIPRVPLLFNSRICFFI